MSCIDTPISWLRLEQFAVNGDDPHVAAHLARCPACASCLAQIRRDVVALPTLLALPARHSSGRHPWWSVAVPSVALIALAALALVLVWPRPPQRHDTVRIKGIGEVVLGLVRERDGVIRDDATTFLPDDRWKIVVTCAPPGSVWIEAHVGDDQPLPLARIACGNRVVLPGAFHLTGTAPNRICIRVGSESKPGRGAPSACATVDPEPPPSSP